MFVRYPIDMTKTNYRTKYLRMYSRISGINKGRYFVSYSSYHIRSCLLNTPAVYIRTAPLKILKCAVNVHFISEANII